MATKYGSSRQNQLLCEYVLVRYGEEIGEPLATT